MRLQPRKEGTVFPAWALPHRRRVRESVRVSMLCRGVLRATRLRAAVRWRGQHGTAAAAVGSGGGGGGGKTAAVQGGVAPAARRGETLQTRLRTGHPRNNIPESIASRVGRGLHVNPRHPLGIIKSKVEKFFQQTLRTVAVLSGEEGPPAVTFRVVDDLSPIVHVQQNFDDLLIPPDHVSRSPSDTYYIDDTRVLRTHTSAHQSTFIREGESAFLVAGDVYRRDEIDRSHYPIFHQMEGVRIFDHGGEMADESLSREERVEKVVLDLKQLLEGMARHLFGEVEMRWIDTYFPFTEPSFELEIFYEGEWLEVLGCGVIEQQLIRNSGRGEALGWAFGLGLERLAMVLFSIPDIRLFWTTDERFLSQFSTGEIVKFKPYSKYPGCYKDVSIWIEAPTDDTPRDEHTGPTTTTTTSTTMPETVAAAETVAATSSIDTNTTATAVAFGAAEADDERLFHDNDVYEVIRDVAGDLVEQVQVIDDFVHPSTHERSKCYRITYRHMDRSLSNEEINAIQSTVRERIAEKLPVRLR